MQGRAANGAAIVSSIPSEPMTFSSVRGMAQIADHDSLHFLASVAISIALDNRYLAISNRSGTG
jgi:hypothetical protein